MMRIQFRSEHFTEDDHKMGRGRIVIKIPCDFTTLRSCPALTRLDIVMLGFLSGLNHGVDGCLNPRKSGGQRFEGLIFFYFVLPEAIIAGQAHADPEFVCLPGGQGGVVSLRGKLLDAQAGIHTIWA